MEKYRREKKHGQDDSIPEVEQGQADQQGLRTRETHCNQVQIHFFFFFIFFIFCP